MTIRSTILAASAVLTLSALPALATSTKTWVSSTGADTGACPLTAPCKTFQYAHDQTTAGGEIDVKDTGSYGQVTITKAISIVSGDGALAAVGVPSGGTGITINAGAQDRVILEGLIIDGHGIGGGGILETSALSLKVESCHIRNVTQYGLYVEANTIFHVENTDISGVTNMAMYVSPNSFTSGTLTKDSFTDSGYGLHVDNVNVEVIDVVASGNQIGMFSGFNANILLGASTVSANTQYGIQIAGNGSVVHTYGDNFINANATDVEGTLTSLAQR